MNYIVPQKLVLVGLVLIVVAAFPTTYGKEVSFHRLKPDPKVKQEDLHYGTLRSDPSPPPPPKANEGSGPGGPP